MQVALTEIEEERQRWEQEKKKVTANVLKSQKILLDVGGYKYTTSLTTMTSIDNSMLASMFSGKIPNSFVEAYLSVLLNREPD